MSAPTCSASWHRGVSLSVICAAMLATPCTAMCADTHAPASPPPPITVAANVEPNVVAALDAALAALPREFVLVLTIDRAAALPVPDDAPLSARLLGRAALMVFRRSPPTITVFDGAVGGTPSWGQPAPDAASLGALLNDLADLLDVPSGAHDDAAWLELAWCAFVARVDRLGDDQEGADRVHCPPPGDPAVLDRFLRHGVRVALGGLSPGDPGALEALLIHELGHAVQFGPNADAHLRAWGELSGWRIRSSPAESDRENRASGFADRLGGGFAMEHMGERAAGRIGGLLRSEDPIVLIRLILGDRRHGVLYSTPCLRCFVTAYAEFDMAEDYAESFRMMATDPERLAMLAPEKFMFVNAVGWSARLDLREPGPLWIDAKTIRDAEWRDDLIDAVNRLLRDDDHPIDGPRIAASTITALLRAHSAVFDAHDLPRPHRFPAPSPDMPSTVYLDALEDDLAFDIDGVRHAPPPSAVIAAWERAFRHRRDLAELDAQMHTSLGSVDALREAHETTVRTETDPETRLVRFVALMPAMRDRLDRYELLDLVAAEARFHEAHDRPLVAARLRVDANMPFVLSPALSADAGVPLDQMVDLNVAIARRHLRYGQFDDAEQAITALDDGINADVHAVELLIELAQLHHAEASGDDHDDDARGQLAHVERLLDAAELRSDRIRWPGLRREAIRSVERARGDL